MASEQKLRETIIWLAGLLSTDGTVERVREGGKTGYKIASSEREWLEQIADKLAEVGIKTSIFSIGVAVGHGSANEAFNLRVHMPYRITQFLKKYAEGFMMKRKWERVISAYQGRSRNLWAVNCEKKHLPWMPEEDQFLVKNYSRMSYHDIAKHLDRETGYAVGHRVKRLKQIGVIPLGRKKRCRNH